MSSPRQICVYCGSSNRAPAPFMTAAFEFGRIIGRAGIGLIYGGGRVGLMGRVADGVLVEGGSVTGIIPGHLHEREVAHRGLNELLVVDTMHERKRLMAERADAFVVLPGGLGTLDELFEIVTWRQLGLHDKPIVLVDLDDYWRPLLALIDQIVAQGFAGVHTPLLFARVGTIEEVLPYLASASPPDRELSSRLL